MSESESSKPAKKSRIRIGRMFVTMLVLVAAGGAVYGASLLNVRRFFLIVDATEVRVAKGRMLPVGHEPFVPTDPALRKAYETVPLPGGMKLPRGETVFTDRVQLDQALYRILKDATAFALSADNKRTPEIASRCLAQMKALPGINVAQQLEMQKLGRDAGYVQARGSFDQGKRALKEAAKQFRESSRGGGGGRYTDGEARARTIEAALKLLEGPLVPETPPTTAPAKTDPAPTPPPDPKADPTKTDPKAAPDPNPDPVKASTSTATP